MGVGFRWIVAYRDLDEIRTLPEVYEEFAGALADSQQEVPKHIPPKAILIVQVALDPLLDALSADRGLEEGLDDADGEPVEPGLEGFYRVCISCQESLSIAEFSRGAVVCKGCELIMAEEE